MKKLIKLVIRWFLLGALYFLVEVLGRAPRGEWPHWSMWIGGGLCGLAVGGINQIPAFFRLGIRAQSAIGTVATLAVELLAGCFLNLHLYLINT